MKNIGKLHLMKKLNIDVFECEICGFRTTYVSSAILHNEKHISEHHNEEAERGLL